MPRPNRIAARDVIYHVLNRANGRGRIFEQAGDYRAFERVLEEAAAREAMRLLAYCVMPNHWHLVIWPRRDGDLSSFVGWLTQTHAQRWHAYRDTGGAGHVYQGRFKSFPVQSDEHLLIVCRYVERNPLRAGLVNRAERWRWSSLWRRTYGDQNARALLAPWPVPRPSDWCAWVNRPQTAAELDAIRTSLVRGRPFGDIPWGTRIATALGLESTYRARGRPTRGS